MFDTGAAGELSWRPVWILQSRDGDVIICIAKEQPTSISAAG